MDQISSTQFCYSKKVLNILDCHLMLLAENFKFLNNFTVSLINLVYMNIVDLNL